MCGLAGSFTQASIKGLTDKQRLRRARVLEGLLVANASRGTDATGIATICGDDRCVYKRAKPSYQFVDDATARKHLRTKAPLVIGHTRYGTTGANNDDNAHPFEEGNIIGAHNGVISNYTSIDAALRDEKGIATKDYLYSRVDSQAVFRLLDHAGPGDYIDALSKVRGSAALVWHDKRNPDGLWMVRHSNPINLAWVPSMQTLFWSSQYDHLSSVLWGVFGDNWFSVGTKENVLYLFKRNDILDMDSWDVKFDEYRSTATSQYITTRFGHGAGDEDEWNEYWEARGLRGSSFDDPDDDGDVEHPYAVATVARKDEGKGKAASTSHEVAGAAGGSSPSGSLLTTTSETSLSESGLENVLSVLNRMGVPFDATDESGSQTSTFGEVEAGDSILAPFDDPNCSVCMQPLEEVEMGRYFQRSGEWICSACLTYWEDEGPGLIEAMGHA